MRILFVTQELDQDSDLLGTTVLWIRALARRVQRVHVLALSVGHVSLPPNVVVHSMGKERAANKLLLLARFQAVLFSLALRREIDLVFVHMVPHYAILAAPVARAARLPVVLWYTRAAVTARLRVAHWLVQHCVTASRESFRLPSTKLTVTGHGIDVERFCLQQPSSGSRSWEPGSGTGSVPGSELPDPSSCILAVARISRIKDHETLVRAVALLKEREPERPLRLRIVGAPLYGDDHVYATELRRLAAQLGIDGIVDFAGSLPNHALPPEYDACRVLVNTSRTGSVDRVVLEAMACGRPVVTCNEAFAPILGARVTSLMFPPGDAAALAERLAYVLSLPPEEARSLGQELRAIAVRDHSLDGWADRVVAVFESLVRARPRTHTPTRPHADTLAPPPS